jgi:hypothetical protein
VRGVWERTRVSTMLTLRVGKWIVRLPWIKCRKVRYGRESTALKAAVAMNKKTRDRYDAYRCDECNAWHIGHART